MKIQYSLFDNERPEYSMYVEGLILQYGARKICDVGGGANPVVSHQFITDHGLDYTILDISRTEMEKAPKEYRILIGDIEEPPRELFCQFDFVVSKMLAEHLRDGKRFHENVFSMLQPGGIAVHYFPTLYTLPFLVNKFVPEELSSFLLNVFIPRDRYRLGKFRAYYSWCFGPTPPMLEMLAAVGYEVVLYNGFFGNAYYSNIPVLRGLHQAYAHYLVAHPNAYLTSFAQVVLRKPVNTSVNDQV